MHSFLLAKLRLLKPLFGQHRDNRNCYICARNFAQCSQTTGETKHLHILATMYFTRSSESKKAFRSDTLQKRTFRWPCFYLFIYLFILLFFFSINFLHSSVGDLFMDSCVIRTGRLRERNNSGFSSQFYPNF